MSNLRELELGRVPFVCPDSYMLMRLLKLLRMISSGFPIVSFVTSWFLIVDYF